MKTELDIIKFQWYLGNIKKPIPQGEISLRAFIEKHQNPTTKILEVFDKIEEAALKGDKKLKAKLKQENLFYFTPSAIFNGRRKYTNISRFSSLAQIDIDGLEHDDAIDLKSYLFDNYEEIYCSYLSPSRKGVKALIRIPEVESIEEFKEYYAGIENELNWIAGFDGSPKNVSLPLFLSYDTEILFREEAKIWNTKCKLQDATTFQNLTSKKPEVIFKDGDETVYKSQAYYRKITVDIFVNKLSTISDAGHGILRNAALVLGSRVGAGYLTQGEAEQIAENEITGHSYLKKGIANYIKTAKWAIRNGINNPKYYS